jgi:acetyltransferase-like isoleucine patch superfamily enzyme
MGKKHRIEWRRVLKLWNMKSSAPKNVRSTLAAFTDQNGNVLVASTASFDTLRVTFTGANNRVEIAHSARLGSLTVVFDCDNVSLVIGPRTRRLPKFSADIRVGQDSTVEIAEDVSTTNTVIMSACEGTSIRIGRDSMIASNVQIRADDGHPIFNVADGSRANPSRDIHIGEHVWVAYGVVVLGGATLGDGSVMGMNSLVTGKIPNNVIAVGSPA